MKALAIGDRYHATLDAMLDGLVNLSEATSNVLRRHGPALLVMAVVAVVVFAAPDVIAGTSATFDDLDTEATASVFGPLGRTAIAICALAGTLMAALKGAWLFAGLGIAVAGLMVGAQIVAQSGTFTAVLPFLS